MTANQQFLDASIRHQIDLLRFGSGVARKVNGLLDATLDDLRAQVERRLGKTSGLDSTGLRRLRELESAIVRTRNPAWNDVTEEWTRTATDVALEEPIFVSGVLTNALPVQLDLVQPSAGTLRALVTTRPFQGRLLKEWAQSAQRSDLTRIQQQIRIGMVQGESSRDIAARVFGARGAMAITRNQAEAVTRTVVNGVSNAAQQEFLKDNADLFDVERFVATLDSRTSPVCRAQDGKEYPIGKGPVPPLHVNCRSLRVAVIDGEVIGERPFKAATEQQMLREYAAEHGLGKLGSRDDLPRGHKSAYDAFKRKRARELTGRVPARTTYQDWLSRQPADIQDDILGPMRGKLFREGGLTLDRFVNRAGDELSLDELRARNRAAFEKAGLGEPVRKAATPPKSKPKPEPKPPPPVPAPSPEPKPEPEAPQPPVVAPRPDPVANVVVHGNVSPDLVRAVEDTIERVAPVGAGQLAMLEVHDVDVFRVPGFGSVISADGYYEPELQRVKLATRLPTPSKALSDANWVISDTASTQREAVERLVTHEYGHHVHFAAWERVDEQIREAYAKAVPKAAAARSAGIEFTSDVKDSEGAPSRYGTANHLEFWAESFSAYHYDRAWLRANKPVAYSMVERVLGLLSR